MAEAAETAPVSLTDTQSEWGEYRPLTDVAVSVFSRTHDGISDLGREISYTWRHSPWWENAMGIAGLALASSALITRLVIIASQR